MNIKLKFFFENYWLLLLVLAVKLILQFVVVNPVYELHRDEFLHLDQANHLAFGFISVPPFTSLISKIILSLGGGLFWIRFFPAVFGALTIVFAWLIVEEAGGKIISKIIVSFALLFSLLVRLNILFQPNSFDILIWTIIFYLIIKYINSGNHRLLYYLAVILALGLYNKYTVIFLLAGLFIGFLLTTQRKIFTEFSFWKAVGIALLLFLPNIIWQVGNHFPVVEHMKVLKENQLDNNSPAGFLTSQVMFFFGSVPLTVFALAAFVFHKPFKPYRFIGICFIGVMTLFAIFKAKDYYAIGLFPVIFAFGGVFIERWLTNRWKLVIVPLLVVFNLGVFFLMFKYSLPVLSPKEIVEKKETFEKMGLLRWEDGKNHMLPQDFSDMLGWREMADKTLAAYRMIPESELDNTMVLCDNYGQTGALNYYNRGKMKETYSFSTDYIYWLPHLKRIQNILLVGEKPDENIIRMFSECKLVGVVENEFAREKGTEIFLLTGADPSLTDKFYQMVEERKKNLDIF